MEAAVVLVVFFVSICVAWFAGYIRGRRQRITVIPPTRYRDPANFRCERCTHRIADHTRATFEEHPHCLKGCHCSLSQNEVWKAAERWAITPPSSDVLMQFIREQEK